MARVTPKTNWVAGNVPLGPDLNRMEGNAQQAFDEIDANESQRAIDEAALQSNIDAEETRAKAAEDAINEDLGGLDFVNGNAGTYSLKAIGQNERWVIPKGAYIFTGIGTGSATEYVTLQVYTGSGWAGFSGFHGGFILSDGVNFALTGLNVSTPGTVFYRKLA